MSTNIEKTQTAFGYDANLLKPGSDKLVYVICDYCGEESTKKNSYLKISRKFICKDACRKCQQKKNLEINPTAKPGSLEKRRKTNLAKYGSENYYDSKDFKDKSKATCLKKYGVEHATQNTDIKNKVKQVFLDKYGVDNPSKHPDVIAKIKSHAATYDNKTYKEWADELGIAYSSFMERKDKYGFDIAVKMVKTVSGLELKMASLLDELKVKYHQQFRVEQQYADFFLPDHNLIIECDGLFWHSDYNIKDNDYHFKKKELYNSKGYVSLFFREDEINNQFDIVKSILTNKLGLNERKFFARKCEVVSGIDGKEFLDKYHLMGSGRGDYFALTHNNEILAVMQVKKTDGESNSYEISRFATLPSVSIVGGYTKLLNYVERAIKPTLLVNFIDRRYGNGSFLPACGFSLVRCEASFKWATKDKTVHRMKFPSNTGYDAGFAKIWDCGQLKYVKSYPA